MADQVERQLQLDDIRRSLLMIKAIDPEKRYIIMVSTELTHAQWENLAQGTEQMGLRGRVLFMGMDVEVIALDPELRYVVRTPEAPNLEAAASIEQKLADLGVKAKVIGMPQIYEVIGQEVEPA